MSDRDEKGFEPRHRIVGAIILVTFGLILFSVLLDDQPRMRTDGTATQPETPETRVIVTPVPQPEIAPKAESAPAAAQAPAEPTPAPKPASQGAVQSPGSAPQAAPPEPAPKPTVKAAPVTAHWMVQVGVFANSANARELRDRLKAERYPVELKVVALKQGTGVRVRVGPYVSKGEAEAAQRGIQKKFNVKGVVLSIR